MSPKEKAKELLGKYVPITPNAALWVHKQCALIAVDQILPCTWKLETYKRWGLIDVDEITTTEYWEDVINEINNL